MRTLIHAALIAGLVSAPAMPLAAADTAKGEEMLAKLTAGRIAGKPVDCINLGLSRDDSHTIPGIGMAYRQGTTWYVSRFEDGCDPLRNGVMVVTRLHSSQLCRGDIAELRMAGPNIPMGSCIFGAFTPYTKPR